MDAFALGNLWSAAAGFPSFALCDSCLHLRFHQFLVTIDLLDYFLNLLKLFLAVASDRPKLLTCDKEWMRLREKDE
jgi:hypothetical protein